MSDDAPTNPLQRSETRKRRSLLTVLWNPYGDPVDTEEAKRLAGNVYRLVVVSWLIIFVVWIINTLFLWGFRLKLDAQRAGQFGDTFGSINALFSGLALAGVAYAIVLQHDELSETKKQTKDAKDALDEEKRERERTARISHERHAEQSRYQAQQAVATFIMGKMNAVSAIIQSHTMALSIPQYGEHIHLTLMTLIQFDETQLHILREELYFRYRILNCPSEKRTEYASNASLAISRLSDFWENYFNEKKYPYGLDELLTKTTQVEADLLRLSIELEISIDHKESDKKDSMNKIIPLLRGLPNKQPRESDKHSFNHMNKIRELITNYISYLNECHSTNFKTPQT